ncbi:MAG: hypothetical protein Q8L36_00380 [bacterium]|nr:hypothetical protein [bacterium]
MKTKKIFLKIAVSIVGLFLIIPNAGAQTTAIKKAVEDIKDSVDLLIGAKDNDTESLAFRLETFKKVTDLAITEAKDLKIKIIAFETENKEIKIWKENQIEKLNKAIEYYSNQQEIIADQKEIGLDDLKKIAQELRDWRETNFRTIAEETGNFFLIQQENKAIETAQKRFQKIKKDVEKLKTQKIKNIKRVDAYLEKSEKLISKSLATNQEAMTMFWKNIEVASSSKSIVIEEEKEIVKTSASSTDAAEKLAPEKQEPSIKDLVYTSLDDLKGTYQTFIELSNLVRELLK